MAAEHNLHTLQWTAGSIAGKSHPKSDLRAIHPGSESQKTDFGSFDQNIGRETREFKVSTGISDAKCRTRDFCPDFVSQNSGNGIFARFSAPKIPENVFLSDFGESKFPEDFRGQVLGSGNSPKSPKVGFWGVRIPEKVPKSDFREWKFLKKSKSPISGSQNSSKSLKTEFWGVESPQKVQKSDFLQSKIGLKRDSRQFKSRFPLFSAFCHEMEAQT